MATYTVNKRAVAHARKLIDARRCVLDSDWGEAQPRAIDENEFLESHSWEAYAAWPRRVARERPAIEAVRRGSPMVGTTRKRDGVLPSCRRFMGATKARSL